MNKFKLCSMLAITPFLQDRSPKSLAQIKHVRMSFGLDKDGAKRRHKLWRSTLDYMRQSLRLKILDINICFYTVCSMAETEGRAPIMQWVESLISINKLEALNVDVYFPEPDEDLYCPHRMESNKLFEFGFIEYLKSNMLKSKAAASIAQA